MEEIKPVGLFIVENEKGQFIYDDPFTEGGYLISKSLYAKFRTYSMRYVLGIIVGTLLSTFIPVWPSVGAAIATVIVGEVLFRAKFLAKQCIYMPRYKRPEGTKIYETIAKSTTRPKKLLKGILFILFGLLFVQNAYIENYPQVLLYICYGIGVICVFLGLLYFVGFAKDGGKNNV